MSSALVFVYGTLKQGFPNHEWNRGTHVQGDWITVQPYELYLVGCRWVPWMLYNSGMGHRIPGEVYRVTPAELAHMDDLEDVGRPNGYIREKIQVHCQLQSTHVDCWVYLKQVHELEAMDIKAGPLDAYRQEHTRDYTRKRGASPR